MKKNFFNIKKIDNKINIGFFTSSGGVSRGIYKSLNCSSNTTDNKKHVLKNINIASKKLNLGGKKLKFINQIHSNKTYFINNKNYMKKFYGDGLITNEKNIALAVLTADCAPVFIFDINQNIICCIHSGWKGSLSNIIEKSVKIIRNKKIKRCDLTAVIGPCIGYDKFEVDKKFKDKFIKKNKFYSNFFKSKNKNKDLFNLRGLLNHQLYKEGVNNIYNISKDTYKNSHIFFSHRRACHENSTRTGRMINIISFKD